MLCLVDELEHALHPARHARVLDRHGEDGGVAEIGGVVDGRVEPRVLVRVADVDDFPRRRNAASKKTCRYYVSLTVR